MERPTACLPVSLAHGRDAARAGELRTGAAFLLRNLSATGSYPLPYRSSRSVGAVASSGTCSRPGSIWGWTMPLPAQPPNCWTSSLDAPIEKFLWDSRGAVQTDRPVQPLGYQGLVRKLTTSRKVVFPDAVRSGRERETAHRGVGHRRGRRAQSSPDRQRHPSRTQEEPVSAKALAGGIPRSQGLSLLPD